LLRNKYKSLLSFAMLGVSLGVGALIYSHGRSIDAAISGYQSRIDNPLLGEKFDQLEFVMLGELIDKMDKLPYPPVVKSRDVRFAILDDQANKKIVKMRDFVRVKPFNYKVSMVFISEQQRYAVISGGFVHVGDLLRDGAVVEVIQKGRVKISRPDGSRWIKVRSPDATREFMREDIVSS